jgi:hypothetical protein
MCLNKQGQVYNCVDSEDCLKAQDGVTPVGIKMPEKRRQEIDLGLDTLFQRPFISSVLDSAVTKPKYDPGIIDKIEENTCTIHEILKRKFNWGDAAFVDGMAPMGLVGQKQAWKPRIKMLRKLIGGSNGIAVPLEDVLVPGCFLKFCIPSAQIQGTADFSNWRGYFDRETQYTDTSAGFIFDRRVTLLGFADKGFRFDVEYIDASIRARTPSVVFFGAQWIKLSPPIDKY